MTIITKTAGKPAIGLLAVLAALAYSLTGCPDSGGGDGDPAPSVESITIVSPGSTTLEKGKPYTFVAVVKGKNISDQSVTWALVEPTVQSTISGGSDGNTATLRVGGSETYSRLTVKATSNADSSKSITASVTVSTIVAPGEVKITGTAQIGQKLTANTEGLGSGDFTYQWYRHESAEAAAGMPISGATSKEYSPVIADLGKFISVTVTYGDSRKTSQATEEVQKPDLEITPSNGEVAPGDILQLTASRPADKWNVEGKTSEKTTITNKGLLTVGNDETPSAILRVTAVMTGDSTKIGTATFMVSSSAGTLNVTFDSKGGTPVATQTGVKTAVEPREPTKTGYTFDGWYTEGLTTKWNFSAPVTPNLILYAKWTLVRYKITYEMNDSEDFPAIQTPEGEYTIESAAVTLPAEPTRRGYRFDGWYTKRNPSATDDKVTEIPQGSTGDQTYYAKWTARGTTSGFVYYWVNEQDNLSLSVASFSLSNGGTLTIAPQNDSGYTEPKWYVNGVLDAATGNTYIFTSEGRDTNAKYTVGLQVVKNGRYYYKEISIKLGN